MYTTEGIILKKTDAGEAGALFTLYTRDFGKIRALAQGIKREGAKLKGHLEPLNLCRIGFVLGKNGERLTYAEMLNSWRGIRESLGKLEAALEAAALVDERCFPGEKDEGLWQMLLGHLRKIENEEKMDKDVPQFFAKQLFEYLSI